MTRRKKVPFYWWDFNGNEVIVESDSPKYPCVARFPFKKNNAMFQIDQAEALIAELNAGRKKPTKVDL